MAVGIVLLTFLVAGFGRAPMMVMESPTPEPIVPTRMAQPVIAVTATPVVAATPIVDSLRAGTADLTPKQAAVLNRIGVAGALPDVERAADLGLRFGQFTFWRTWHLLPEVPNLAVWQTVRLGQIGEWGEWPAVRNIIELAVERYPGSFWMIGNEPDVPWQDNATAEEYAVAYHDIYSFIKSLDPGAQIGAGGIALPTPLRLAYLDDVLRIYQEQYGEPMPVDLWAIHLFTLREELDSWGIGIPPGRSETAGQLYEIADHGDMELMKSHVVAFRDWMAENDYGDKPLAVTEFGILLPEDYGFPPDFVQRYMAEAFDYFATATGENGLADDGGRLVQYAFWYSLYDDGEYQTGNLMDGERGILTPLGEAFIQYVDDRLAAP